MPPSTKVPTSASKPRPKFTPKPPRPTEERLKKLNATLVDQIGDGYLENGIKTCRKILALSPASIPTFQTLLFLLLQTDDYPTALDLVESFSSSSSSSSDPVSPTSGSDTASARAQGFEFEKAYCLYRLHREDEALVILEGIKKERGGEGNDDDEDEDEDQRKCKHLEGQILYRKSSLPPSLSLYTSLLSTTPPSSPERSDINQNLQTIQDCISFDPSGLLSEGEKRALEQAAPVIPTSVSVQIVKKSSSAKGSEKKVGAGAGAGAVAGSSTGKGTAGGKTSGTGTSSVQKKPRHKLPKGVAFSEKHMVDPERWLPLKLRTVQPNATSTSTSNKKKSNKSGGGGGGGTKKEGMGAGMTQGSTGDGGGKGGKKGKRK